MEFLFDQVRSLSSFVYVVNVGQPLDSLINDSAVLVDNGTDGVPYDRWGAKITGGKVTNSVRENISGSGTFEWLQYRNST